MQPFRHRRPDMRTLRSHPRALVLVAIGVLALAVILPPRLEVGTVSQVSTPMFRTEGTTPSYRQEVGPILQRACTQCHGTLRADKGLRLDSYQRMMAGDAFGTVVIPGDASLSALVSVVRYGTMPHQGARLTANEIDTISRWIDAGAPEN
ncbi:MAG: c-type cytochrome domain-containing protein [Chloroflexota bacterium]